ncbi:hypothetical protein DPM33_18915 [Mesorhizobium hawassense]|uniref:Uncharacterized protein n=1 Tax=Mesorhizobium hawassense TaxID=1209954 RepID=A0A330HM63_9HYPH|nr:hypothetical protein [Mesorhizobium hawassense]RAZ89050.1 hypothetical protein DPM33_18915 [Mesorhizobium hawassense]
MTAPERERSKLLSVRTACAGLMALLMLALLSFAQAEMSASAFATPGGSNISAARQGDTIALLRTTGKAQALEVRASRLLPMKLVSGIPGALAHASDFLIVGQALPAEMGVAPGSASAIGSRTNQPRAPPVA